MLLVAFVPDALDGDLIAYVLGCELLREWRLRGERREIRIAALRPLPFVTEVKRRFGAADQHNWTDRIHLRRLDGHRILARVVGGRKERIRHLAPVVVDPK